MEFLVHPTALIHGTTCKCHLALALFGIEVPLALVDAAMDIFLLAKSMSKYLSTVATASILHLKVDYFFLNLDLRDNLLHLLFLNVNSHITFRYFSLSVWLCLFTLLD